jgi:hypothetical protein
LGAADEFFAGLMLGFGFIVGFFMLILIGAVIGSFFGYMVGGIFLVIILPLFFIAIAYRFLFSNHQKLMNKKRGLKIRDNHHNNSKSDVAYTSFSISQDDYSNQIEGYTKQKNGNKKRWK